MLPVTTKLTVWPASLGPAEIAVAQPATVWAPASSSTVWSAPFVKTGASLTGLTVSETVAVALFAEPSFTRYVNESDPL